LIVEFKITLTRSLSRISVCFSRVSFDWIALFSPSAILLFYIFLFFFKKEGKKKKNLNLLKVRNREYQNLDYLIFHLHQTLELDQESFLLLELVLAKKNKRN